MKYFLIKNIFIFSCKKTRKYFLLISINAFCVSHDNLEYLYLIRIKSKRFSAGFFLFKCLLFFNCAWDFLFLKNVYNF